MGVKQIKDENLVAANLMIQGEHYVKIYGSNHRHLKIVETRIKSWIF